MKSGKRYNFSFGKYTIIYLKDDNEVNHGMSLTNELVKDVGIEDSNIFVKLTGVALKTILMLKDKNYRDNAVSLLSKRGYTEYFGKLAKDDNQLKLEMKNNKVLEIFKDVSEILIEQECQHIDRDVYVIGSIGGEVITPFVIYVTETGEKNYSTVYTDHNLERFKKFNRSIRDMVRRNPDISIHDIVNAIVSSSTNGIIELGEYDLIEGYISIGDEIELKDKNGVQYLFPQSVSNLINQSNHSDIQNAYVIFEKANRNNEYIDPILIHGRRRRNNRIKPEYIPISIHGLDEILFPNEEIKAFRSPKKDATVQQIILIKGAPGTGKTTLAVQMMIYMAKNNINCNYWCTNENENKIKFSATSFKFESIENINELIKKQFIVINDIGSKYLEHIKLGGKIQGTLENTDVLFVDSLNVSQITHADRALLFDIFCDFKKPDMGNMITFFLLEDYGDDGTSTARELISDCEFLADVVIELQVDNRKGYHTKTIQVKKKHYGSQAYGKHLYRICPPDHSLSNIMKDRNGIVLFQSIHKYLSGSHIKPFEVENVHSGIAHLDLILSGENRNRSQNCISSDSCIVLRGKQGCHKLPISFNMLLGGLWKIDENRKVCIGDDVLIILLNEETTIHFSDIALAKNSGIFTNSDDLVLDNGEWIDWNMECKVKCKKEVKCSECSEKDNCKEKKCNNFHLFNHCDNKGKKVYLYKQCVKIKAQSCEDCRKLVVAAFRPGFINPEEFITIISELIGNQEKPNFKRVLFTSTAYLHMFPLIDGNELFLPALIDFFKSRNVLSIFNDVEGNGANEKLSFNLASMADYLVMLDYFDSSKGSSINIKFPQKIDNSKKEIIENDDHSIVCSRMQIENIRGKNYSRKYHAVTVREIEDKNELFIFDIDQSSNDSPKIKGIE